MSAALLRIDGLHLEIRQRRKRFPVLRGASLELKTGSICGLVGESGAGKSMIAKALLGLLPRSAHITGGEILFENINLLKTTKKAHSNLLGKRISLIPQDPMGSLNPVRKIGAQMIEGLQKHLALEQKAATNKSLMLLEEVLINEPERVLKSYAHELSGGMRQRVLIAMAFSCEPDLIIADEPTTALDVTVQKRVLSLIRRMQSSYNTSILFVTHDLGVVAKLCDEVFVMHAGRIVESGNTDNLFQNPIHPYTQALMHAMPRYDEPDKALTPVPEALIQTLWQEAYAYDQQHTGL
ncbi:MAG: ABC transporter ATP-binding protein [Arenicellales bacterium WSBS_2016_MAG_OTU3]